MRKSRYFRLGSRVIAYSLLTNERIIGIYKQSRSTFGVVIHGKPLGSNLPELDHICSKLSMELYNPPIPPGSLTLNKLKIKAGDRVQASNSMGLIIKGFYMNKDGKYAWIKGHKEGESLFTSPRAHKVIFSTLFRTS